MAALHKRWYRSRRNQFVIFVIILGLIAYFSLREDSEDLDLTKRVSVMAYIESKLQEQLKLDKGSGCEMPVLDPFAEEVTRFDKDLPRIVCPGLDWVKCHLSECQVVKEVLASYTDVACSYKDIIHESDDSYTLGSWVKVRGKKKYHLRKSDHVKISCTATNKSSFLNILPARWEGHGVGFRSTVARQPVPPGREDAVDVLIFAFDSTAKNGFIRRMPKSYKFLTEELKATVLQSYNIVGDGTPAAMFPILTGRTELELPDARRKMRNHKTCDDMPFIFYKLRDDGYRTAYFEDMPWIGTFQYRFNGFRHQPADHYLRSFFQEESGRGKRWWKNDIRYCVGATPQYKLMMNLTNQFFHLDGKKFALTFIADVTHDDFNQIPSADEDFVEFLSKFKSDGFLEKTLLIVMGDHGPRYAHVRNTYQGKLEERLPLMALSLPPRLRARRPGAQRALRDNARVLSTPHDVHATLLDAMDLRRHWNPYRVTGADLPRGMTLLEPIPLNRSCSEAGIEPHWCACVSWRNVSTSDPLHRRASLALLDYINSLTDPLRAKCRQRELSKVWWVMKQQPSRRMLSFTGAKDPDGYVGRFGQELRLQREMYQVKISVGPGQGDFEASMTYLVDKDQFHIDGRDISRTNMYGSEPDCISKTHPHLNPYCFCSD